MKNVFISLLISTLAVNFSATAQQNTAGLNLGAKNIDSRSTVELFKRTLAHIPAILLSTVSRFKGTQYDYAIFQRIVEMSAENLTQGDPQQYMRPEKYVNFTVEGTSNQAYFTELRPGEGVRTASTRNDLKSPILINEKIVNDPSVSITLIEVVSILLHEIGRKLPHGETDQMRNLVDQFVARVVKVLNQDYQTISLSPTETLHILNSPYAMELPKISARVDKESFAQQIGQFKTHFARLGREILIFYQNENGFSYVPTLKPLIMDEIKSIKALEDGRERVVRTSSSNIEEIRIDRTITQRPFVRFLINIRERIYNYQEDKLDKNTVDAIFDPSGGNLQSYSAIVLDPKDVSEGDETFERKVEFGVFFNNDGSVKTSTRLVTEKDPRFVTQDLKWSDNGDVVTGKLRIKIPENAKLYAGPNLRAYLQLRLEDGLARVEVSRMTQQGSFVDVDFVLPSGRSAAQAYFAEEILIKNGDSEVLVDLPEAIVVKRTTIGGTELKLKSLELLHNGVSEDLLLAASKLKREKNKLEDAVKITSGLQTIRMKFDTTEYLSEVYFYLRSRFLSHDPLKKMGIKSFLEMPLFGEILKQVGQSVIQETMSHMQIVDQAIHVPASEMKQRLNGDELEVEFKIPLEIMPDRGVNTYDMGVRNFAKIIAVTRSLRRFRNGPDQVPMFYIEGIDGFNSCSKYFPKK